MAEIVQQISTLQPLLDVKQVGPYPPLEALVQELLGAPYSPERDCWWVVRYLFEAGRGVHLDAQADLNALVMQEVWFRGDARPLSAVVQPWDALVINAAGPLADHAGIILDSEYFVHSRKAIGVCRERWQKWHKRILQVVRVHERE